jgi:hypothetical protein
MGMKRFILLALAFIVFVFAGTMGANYLYNTRTPQISVADQSLSGTRLVVSEVVIPMDGFVVIHPVDDKGAAVLADSLAGLSHLREQLDQSVVVPGGFAEFAGE